MQGFLNDHDGAYMFEIYYVKNRTLVLYIQVNYIHCTKVGFHA